MKRSNGLLVEITGCKKRKKEKKNNAFPPKTSDQIKVLLF